MLLPRVIPCLLLKNRALVKTVQFKNPAYIGDPINTVRIFNEEGADELVFLDITATIEKRSPNFGLIQDIASEAFMPFAYGGGVRSLDDMRRIFALGVEKIIVNTAAHETPKIVSEAAAEFGSQSIVAAIDVKKNIFGKNEIVTQSGLKKTSNDPAVFAREAEKLGAGEILLTSVDRDGSWRGYDLELVRNVASAVNIPVIACGGAGKKTDFKDAVAAGASAAAAGSLFVYQGKSFGVLINYPDRKELNEIFSTGISK